jgi:hypothetical protein
MKNGCRWAWIIARDALPMEHFSMMSRKSPRLMKSGTAIAKGFPPGRESFQSQIENQLEIKLGSGKVGRPPKSN